MYTELLIHAQINHIYLYNLLYRYSLQIFLKLIFRWNKHKLKYNRKNNGKKNERNPEAR